MPEHRFDLIDEPWLPCIGPDGAARELGLRAALLEAHELRELWHPSPLVTVSLHRLLLALLHRALLGPPTIDAWADLWRRGRWDPEPIGAYLERWRHRFDLFDRERPFYQSTSLEEAEGERSIWALAQQASSGNNATLFDHSVNRSPRPMAPAEAARYLVAQQGYAVAGGNSKPVNFSHAPLVKGYTVLAVGADLFQTLILNLMRYGTERPIPWREGDRPTWELSEPSVPDGKAIPPHGYVDYLTWQSRRMRLIPEGEPTSVRRCQILQGFATPDDILDPFKSYVMDKKGGRFSRGLSPDRALWRDSHILFQRVKPLSQWPELFASLAEIDDLRGAGEIDALPTYALSAFGLATDPRNAASVLLWRQERLPLPLAYLNDQDLTFRLEEALALAETVAKVLTGGVRCLAKLLLGAASDHPDGRQPDPDDITNLAKHLAADQRYWSRLEEPFARLLVGLPDDQTAVGEAGGAADSAFRAWATELRRVAGDVFAETTRGLDGSARSLKAVARAQRLFGSGLREKIDPYLVEEVADESPA